MPRPIWPKWVRDPLLVFLLVGAGIFGAHAWLGGDADDRVIVVPQSQIDRLGFLWETQMGRPPSPAELDALIDDHVREEVMVREAQRLRLDEDDAIIRRRLAQKLSFLTEDVATLEPPAADELLAYFEDNRGRYATPAVATFSHIYFSPDRREDPRGDASRTLEVLDADAWRKAGDPFMLGRTYAHANMSRIERDFGTGFVAALDGLAASPDWQGPVESAYGFHLLRVDAKSPALGADYESVASRVARDLDAARRAAANAAYFEELMRQYTVVVP
ncbi:MAG: peptidylprolyl isomerase [Gammaproteobacteria bacterium]|nr:peptidylprolyl isomerase [Gammaproteobacteria bacterium]